MTWHPFHIYRRLRTSFRNSSDLKMGLRIGMFIITVRHQLDRQSLPEFLQKIDAQSANCHEVTNVAQSLARIDHLSRLWLRLLGLRAYRTCYLRAITYFRFLNAPGGRKKIHFVVAPASDRLHGHAWVTIDDLITDPEMEGLAQKTVPLYSYTGR